RNARLKAVFAHQPRQTIASHTFIQLSPCTARPIHSAHTFLYCAQLHHHTSIRALTGGATTIQEGIVTRGRKLEKFTQPRYREVRRLQPNNLKRVHFRSLTKTAIDFTKASRSRFRSANSLRSRRSSSSCVSPRSFARLGFVCCFHL